MSKKTMQADPELFQLMIDDYLRAGKEWQATEYWENLAGSLIELFSDENNLENFRGLPVRTGIKSYFPGNPGRIKRLNARGSALERLAKSIPVLRGLLTFHEEIEQSLRAESVNLFQHKLRVTYLLLQKMYEDGNVLFDWMLGNPDDAIRIEGKDYSQRSMGYQYLYCYLNSHLPCSQLSSVLELGSGYGGQAEVFLRKNSQLKYVAVDIPPWLYVAEVYLNAVFPGQVMGYRETRKIKDGDSILDLMGEKKVAILANWKRPCLADHFDVFWNSKSLQEMDENAAFQLRTGARNAKHLFLHVYTTSKPGVHQPQDLDVMVQNLGTYNRILFEEDLHSGHRNMNMFYTHI